MSHDVAVYDALNTAGISNPIRGWLPQGASLPAAVVRYVSDRPMLTLQGEADLKNQTIAIDCWASSIPNAEALRDQVLTVVNGSSLRAVRLATRPLHEPESDTFRFTIEYSIWG